MNGGQLLTRVGELALEHGPEVVEAVERIISTIEGETDIRREPFPKAAEASRNARERAEAALQAAEHKEG